MAKAQSAPEITLVPKNGIIERNAGTGPDGTRIKDAEDFKFTLFTDDWLALQNFVTGALRLPISTGDFTEKYGTFDADKKSAVTNCVDAFQDLHASAEEFGNPAVLLRELQTLMGGEKPASIYGEIIWVANQIASTANTFSFTYKTLQQILPDDLPQEERKKALGQILSGKGGLRDKALDMEGKANSLVKRLTQFGERIGKSQTSINAYAGKASDIYISAAKKLEELNDLIATTQNEIDKQTKAYIDWTAGAAGGSAAIMVFSCGLLFPLALGWGLGAGLGGAEQARKAKEDAENLINSQQGDKKKKTLLKMDLNGLNSQIGDIRDKVNAVTAGLEAIASVWNTQVTDLDKIVENTQLDKLLTFDEFNQKVGILDAQEKWQLISKTTYKFTSRALVQYREEAA